MNQVFTTCNRIVSKQLGKKSALGDFVYSEEAICARINLIRDYGVCNYCHKNKANTQDHYECHPLLRRLQFVQIEFDEVPSLEEQVPRESFQGHDF